MSSSAPITAAAESPRDTLDADECAALLRCSVDQLEQLAREGQIPGVKIGRGWLFIRADLLAYLAEQARAQAAERRASLASAATAAKYASAGRPPAGATSTGRRQAPPPLPPLPVGLARPPAGPAGR